MYNTVSQPAAGAARFPFLHGGSGGQSPPANFTNFSVDIPLLFFGKSINKGGDICSDMDWYKKYKVTHMKSYIRQKRIISKLQ